MAPSVYCHGSAAMSTIAAAGIIFANLAMAFGRQRAKRKNSLFSVKNGPMGAGRTDFCFKMKQDIEQYIQLLLQTKGNSAM
jgi:hypothetical protein